MEDTTFSHRSIISATNDSTSPHARHSAGDWMSAPPRTHSGSHSELPQVGRHLLNRFCSQGDGCWNPPIHACPIRYENGRCTAGACNSRESRADSRCPPPARTFRSRQAHVPALGGSLAAPHNMTADARGTLTSSRLIRHFRARGRSETEFPDRKPYRACQLIGWVERLPSRGGEIGPSGAFPLRLYLPYTIRITGFAIGRGDGFAMHGQRAGSQGCGRAEWAESR